MKATVLTLFAIRYSLCAVLLAGCATTPPPRAGLQSFLQAHRRIVDSVPYLPSSALAQQLRAKSHWDPEALVWTLRSGRHELRASPKIPVVLIDEEAILLRQAPIFQEGEVLLPESVWRRWLGKWEVPAAAPPKGMPGLRTIVVDPGHGGHDSGAIGRGGLREKAVTLDVGRRLRDLLVGDGFQVVMTRDSDRFVSLSRRSTLANQEASDLFISIHANASRHRYAYGYEVYYLSEATDDHARALEAAENAELPKEVNEPIASDTRGIVWDLLYTEHRAQSNELAAEICRGLRQELSSKNRGVKSARFAVLKGARMPAILVEVGFISNAQEESRLRKASYRQAIAEGIRRGLLNFRERFKGQDVHSP